MIILKKKYFYLVTISNKMPRTYKPKVSKRNQAETTAETAEPTEPYNNLHIQEVEHYDLQKLIYIYYNWNKLGDQVGKAFVNGETVDNVTFKTIVQKLITECKTSEKKFPYCDRDVAYAQNETLKQGRFISKNFALINMARPVRQTIAEGLYQDLDVVNCHLYIYAYLCNQYDFECPQIDYYIDNRDACLEEGLKLNPDCTKDDIKQWYLMKLNGGSGGKKIKFLTTHMKDYEKELEKELHHKLSEKVHEENPEYKDYIIKRDGANVYNLHCKIVSKKLEDHENRMRHYMAEYVRNQKCDFSSHCYDGGMSYLLNNAGDIKKLVNIKKCQEYIFKNTGINCPLKWKDFDQMIPIPKAELDKITINDYKSILLETSNSYEAVKHRFEKNNFFVEEEVRYYYDNDNKVIPYKKDVFIQKYEDMTYQYTNEEGEEVQESFIYKWIKDSKKRRYQTVVWRPTSTKYQPSLPPQSYNLWKGFNVEKIVPDGKDYSEEVQTILKHFKFVVNHLDDENKETEVFYKYFLKWTARLYQYPALKSEVCIGLKSVIQGAGKTTMFDLHTALMGQNLTAKIENPERDMFGDFNELINNRIFILLEECDAAVMTKFNKRFLDSITAKYDNINFKGGSKVTIESYTNYMAVWNTYGLKVPKEDRRTWCMEICAEQAPSKEYFVKLFDCINNPQVQRAFYDYLMNYDLDDIDENGNVTHKYHPSRDRPETELRRQMILQQKDKLELWIRDLTIDWYRYTKGYELYHPNYNYSKDPKKEAETRFSEQQSIRETIDTRKGWLTSDMFLHFTDWLKAYKYTYHVDISTFGKRLNALKNAGIKTYSSGGKSKIEFTLSKSLDWCKEQSLVEDEDLVEKDFEENAEDEFGPIQA